MGIWRQLGTTYRNCPSRDPGEKVKCSMSFFSSFHQIPMRRKNLGCYAIWWIEKKSPSQA
jgi:hypothetical protein